MIGIFGGTFDPIHNGHLRVALDVTEALNLQALHFVPLNGAVHRARPQAAAAERLAMVQAAVGDEPRFVADDRELRRGGDSYTLDTLRDLRNQFGQDTPLCLLLGEDAFAGLPTWHAPEQVMELAHLVVMQRPGCSLDPAPPLDRWIARRRSDDPAQLRDAPGGRMLPLPVTQLAISATDIRHRVATGRSARYLTPDPVLAHIHRHDLYRNLGD